VHTTSGNPSKLPQLPRWCPLGSLLSHRNKYHPQRPDQKLSDRQHSHGLRFCPIAVAHDVWPVRFAGAQPGRCALGRARDGARAGEGRAAAASHQLGAGGLHVACGAWLPCQNVGGSLRIACNPEIPQVVQHNTTVAVAAQWWPQLAAFLKNPGERTGCLGSPPQPAGQPLSTQMQRSTCCQTRSGGLVETNWRPDPMRLARLAALPEGSPRPPLCRTVCRGRTDAESLIEPAQSTSLGPVHQPIRLREPRIVHCSAALATDGPR